MRSERLGLSGDPVALAAKIRSFVPAPATVHEAVAEIIAAVRSGGDAVVHDYARRFDTGGSEPGPLVVTDAELQVAVGQLDQDVLRALELAAENVARVAQASFQEERIVAFERHEIRLRQAPVTRAAIYVPGGRAPYPSTVVMGVVPARVAGVSELAVCSPPGPDGDVHPAILAACNLAGATVVYRMGGAQAIAALAYGTESVPPVDVIVGPGNLYVQEAKRQVFGQVGIDSFAGPSDLVVIADEHAEPELVALDLAAQAEHGPGTLVIAVSTSLPLLDRVGEALDQASDTGAIAALVQVSDPGQALALAEALAPEHLQLVGAEAESLAARVTRAGCVFVGPTSGTAFGDYIAGSNHVLPTGGAARYSSALSPAHFRRSFAEVRIGDGAEALASAAAPLARAEGFELHARSMEARVRDNG
jgi:histidinol dehydrogenase